jgi:hypothetical protein
MRLHSDANQISFMDAEILEWFIEQSTHKQIINVLSNELGP